MTLKLFKLPKTEKEVEFDKMMRTHKASNGTVLNNKSLGSLKKSAKQHTQQAAASSDALSPGEHGSRAPVHTAAARSQSNLGFAPDSTGGFSQKSLSPIVSKKGPGKSDLSILSSKSGERSLLPFLTRPRENQGWVNLSRKDVGKVFGGPQKTYGCGVNLRRLEFDQEAEKKIAKNMKIVNHLIHVYPEGVPLSNDEFSLPHIGGVAAPPMPRQPSRARMGPGFLRIDRSSEPQGYLFSSSLLHHGRMRATSII